MYITYFKSILLLKIILTLIIINSIIKRNYYISIKYKKTIQNLLIMNEIEFFISNIKIFNKFIYTLQIN